MNNSDTNFNKDINVLWVGSSSFVPGGGSRKHTHDYYHFMMIRQGQISAVVNQQKILLHEGESLMIPPDTPHELFEYSNTMVGFYEVRFLVLSKRMQAITESIPMILPAYSIASDLVKEIVEEGSRGDSISLGLTSDYMTSLIDYYFRHSAKQDQSETEVIDTTGFSELSKETVQYIENNYEHEITIQDIATSLGYNANYLSTAFKKDTGKSIVSYITMIRIRKAAELISFSDTSLEEASKHTGFKNLSHFNRTFKKVVGITPGQYRKVFSSGELYGPRDFTEAEIEEFFNTNGFIMSVLGHKKMTIKDILIQVNEEYQ